VPCDVGLQGAGARRIAIVQHHDAGAEIHQRKDDRAPGAARADQHHGLAARAVRSERLGKAVAPAAAVEIVAGGAAVRRDRNRVDRADLRRFGIDRIEERNNVLLERISDVGAGEARSFDGFEQLRQPPSGQAIGVQEMVIAVDPGGGEALGEQRRRQ
jgi:hypothetical protein